jgi:deoxycytidine triphosphate deaminase
MILSDGSIKEGLDAGRIVIEPLADDAVQPSSVDLRVGRQFRVFANSRYPFIDVRQPMEGLTDLVEVTDDEPFILHPGEFVLASTLETVTLPDDLVARLEGKSSLGRLGLLIHSSLPATERILFLHGGQLRLLPIADIVNQQLDGAVVGFDPDTFEVGYHEVTGWYEGPPDRIFEVVLASGRSVRVTGGHNLFTLDRNGDLAKVRTHELVPGTPVATPGRIPDPPAPPARVDLPGLVASLGPDDRLAWRGGGDGLAAVKPADRVALPHPHDEPLIQAAPSDRLAEGDLRWDEVAEVRDTGVVEPVYDLEVRPGGRRIENFLAGRGGVFAANTAGFIDAGFHGHLTLELSNVANLPITIYPGMKIGQLAFFQLDHPAERPYGSREIGSKYQGQEGPTASRFHLNFPRGS